MRVDPSNSPPIQSVRLDETNYLPMRNCGYAVHMAIQLEELYSPPWISNHQLALYQIVRGRFPHIQ